jgi:ABC-type Zn uptake system ZnuABC Zn-binding protein ZnuA
VVATTTHIADFARHVGGDRAVVTSLLPVGADPHTYEPVPSDVRKLAQADLVLTHGLSFDRWADKLIANARNRPVAVVTQGLPLRPGAEESPEGDPHVWHNPQLAKMMVDNIAAALTKVDEAGSWHYLVHASRYKNQINALDRELKAMVAQIPRENRKMVTNHDAFRYYTEYFGFEFIGSIIPGTSTEVQASAGALGELISLMIDKQVNAVFTENTVDPRIAQQIVDQTGAKVLAGLIGDSLGEPGSGAETYESMMRLNTRTIVNALK